jgi:hypothetical protein
MSKATIEELLDLEKAYANIYWDKTMKPFEDLGHLVMHNMKTIGVLANIAEVGQHSEKGSMKTPILIERTKKKLIGNYLVWAFHYANEWGLDPFECFILKQQSNVNRFFNEKKWGKRL